MELRFFWQNGPGNPLALNQLIAAEARLGFPFPEALRQLLLLRNGGTLRATAIASPDGDHVHVCTELFPIERMLPWVDQPDYLVLSMNEDPLLLEMRPNGRLFVLDGGRRVLIANTFDDFVARLQYGDTRWIVGIKRPTDVQDVLESIRRCTSGLLRREGNESSWRGRHGWLRDVDEAGKFARLFLYPNQGDYPEASDCRWILEANIRPDDSAEWRRVVETSADWNARVLHEPIPGLIERKLAAARADEEPLALPSGAISSLGDSRASADAMLVGTPALHDRDRYQRGLARFKATLGEQGMAVLRSLEPICPDMARYVIEFAYGDVLSRPGLSVRDRQIATLAGLAAIGHASPQLKSHIRGSLNAGLTREEIVEVLLQMALFAGFPAAMNGLQAAREVFAQLDGAGRG
jgi:4-carboxymuconolactone decarboxylase